MFGRSRPDPPPQENPSRPGYQNYSRPGAAPPAGGYDSRMSGGYDSPSYGGTPVQRAPAGRQPPPQSMATRGGNSLQLRPIKLSGNNFYAFANIVGVNSQDFRKVEDFYLLLNGQFVLTARPSQDCKPGEIVLTDKQRLWAGIGLGSVVDATVYEPFASGSHAYLGTMDLEVAFASKKGTEKPYDQEQLQELFNSTFENQILAPGQIMLLDVNGIVLQIIVKLVQLGILSQEKPQNSPTTSDPNARGILTRATQITWHKDGKTGINLKASMTRSAGTSIVAPDFKFSEIGIGGLDNEFQAIFRKAFASRLFAPGLIEKMGIMHVKGILLYGPPGTGKTLIARQIGKMLNAREPKIINGPEVLNKFVGQSEENIRKLFADAEKEYKEKGAESQLHIIIFDELDAVCKQRGSGAGGGTGVGDSVVNQLLSKLDGVEKLDNILLIGMTNRKDMIDEALLRAGRLEVHIEIGLPDEAGRVQILNIHTGGMRENNILDRNVNIQELARVTKNFSGAEISGLVRAASSFAFTRHTDGAKVLSNANEIKVKMEDFQRALEETKPLFGVAEDELSECFEHGIIPYSPIVNRILETGRDDISSVRNGARLRTILLSGPPGSGKTALAASLALNSEFPFIKLISPHDMIGMGEASKVMQLDKVFRDADKSPLSIVVVDDIEGLLDWVPIGPRFSNTVLSALKQLITKPPPAGRRRLVLCTTSQRTVLQQLDLHRVIQGEIAVPNVNSQDELVRVLSKASKFTEQDIHKVVGDLQVQTGGKQIGVGIKAVLVAIERSSESDDPPGRFAEIISEAIAQRGGEY